MQIHVRDHQCLAAKKIASPISLVHVLHIGVRMAGSYKALLVLFSIYLSPRKPGPISCSTETKMPLVRAERCVEEMQCMTNPQDQSSLSGPNAAVMDDVTAPATCDHVIHRLACLARGFPGMHDM